MGNKPSKSKKQQQAIARRRIAHLFSLAEHHALAHNLSLANRYVALARKLSMRHLVPIPAEYKRRFCKHCYCYLLPHTSSRIRIHRGRLIIYCCSCQKYTRIPLKQKETLSARLK